MEYKSVIKSIEVPKNESIVTKNVAFIVQRITVDNNVIDIPHPVSAYVQAASNIINTQKFKADKINQFLNFTLREIEEDNDDFIELPQKGLCGLNFIHAAAYLNYSGEELLNAYKTVTSKENIIIDFYLYLINAGILDKDVRLETYTYIDDYGKSKIGIVNPFRSPDTYVRYPDKNSRNKKIKRKNMDIDTWMMLIETAQKRDPIMAFPVYSQIMGGLRRGEVVNLITDAIMPGKDNRHMELDIADRQHILFINRNVNLTSSQVKKPRANQIVLDPFKDLFPLYERHLKIINEIKTRTKSPFKTALLVNDDGLPMTGENYRYRFNKLKDAFLEELQYKSYETYTDLYKTRWGTHIGRGIFTNFIIEQGLADGLSEKALERFVADLRGDKNVESAKDYIDIYNITKQLQKNINNLYQRTSTSVKLQH